MSFPPPVPPPPTQPPVVPHHRTNGMAIASLCCSLGSFVAAMTWILGIIFGHVASSQIERDPTNPEEASPLPASHRLEFRCLARRRHGLARHRRLGLLRAARQIFDEARVAIAFVAASSRSGPCKVK